MTGFGFWIVLSALWIAVCFLPYILNRIGVRGLFAALGNPAPTDAAHSPWAARAMRAHQVAVESFVAMGPLAAIAISTLPDEAEPSFLGMAYFFGLIAHYVVYTLGVPVVRTAAFVVMVLATVGVALTLLGLR